MIIENGLRIYPNPTSGGTVKIQVNFARAVEKVRVSVTGILGNQVLVDEIPNVGHVLNYEVQLGNYPAGIYLVTLQMNEGTVTRKIIKSQ